MSITRGLTARRTMLAAFLFVFVSSAVIPIGAEEAGAVDPIVRVEEDWELRVADVDERITAPQIVMSFTPLGSLDGVHANFELNHLSSVAYTAGGLHLSVWNGPTHLSLAHHSSSAALQTNDETIVWTQSIRVTEGVFVFGISAGHSETWGDFGGAGLELAVTSENASLAAYDPAVSVRESNVSFGGNRVHSLTLKRVRKIHASGEITLDESPRIAHRIEDSASSEESSAE